MSDVFRATGRAVVRVAEGGRGAWGRLGVRVDGGQGRQRRGLAGGGQSSVEGLGHERARPGVQSEPGATLAQDPLAAPSAGRL